MRKPNGIEKSLLSEYIGEKDPSLVTAREKVLWKCQMGHKYTALVRNRREGTGCPYCAGKTLIGYNDISTTHPALAAQWDDDPLKLLELTASSNKKAKWKCERGHRWVAEINSRKKGRGCPYCAGQKPTNKKNLAACFPELIKEWSPANNCSPAAEIEIGDFIKSIGYNIERSDRSLIGKELDIYVPTKALAIEYNGLYWHTADRVGKNYHYNKWLACKRAGVQLITIWEDEWLSNQDIIKNMLSRKLGITKTIGARKTSVFDTNKHTADRLLSQLHIQGPAAGSRYIALGHQDEIIAVGVFKIQGGVYYLERYASCVTIVGGLDKMLRQVGPGKYITFANHCVSDGTLYRKTGWENDGAIKPDYTYVVGEQRIHKFNYRLKRFKDDPSLLYKEGLTERELAELNGLPRIYDCGKTRYVKFVS